MHEMLARMHNNIKVSHINHINREACFNSGYCIGNVPKNFITDFLNDQFLNKSIAMHA